MNLERDRVSELLTGEAREEFLDKSKNIQIKGLMTLADISLRIPDVSKRYKKIFESCNPDGKELIKPQKTMLVSMAALEAFSDLSLENLQNEHLLLPSVLLYRSLACEWDDHFDHKNCTSESAFTEKSESNISASEIWNRGINLIKGNVNVENDTKVKLISDLENAKDSYIYFENELRNEENFKDLDSFETLVLSVEMRKKSFGGISKVITRVLNKGVEDKRLEQKMANATIAFGIIDGLKDLNEDRSNGTMTEAIALHEHSNTRKSTMYIESIKLISNILS